MISKRRDDKGRVLQQGEWQEPSGRYRYKYTDSLGKRKILYSWRLQKQIRCRKVNGQIFLSGKKKEKFSPYRCKGLQEVTLQCLNLWNDIFP